MTLHSSPLHAPAVVVSDIFGGELIPDDHAETAEGLPLSAGWYRLKVSGLAADEVVEVRLDFGLGFVGHHGVRARAAGTTAELFVRLFKQVIALQLLREPKSIGTTAPKISFERLPGALVAMRRVLEQIRIAIRSLRPAPKSQHERPRRLWAWTGLQAFPTTLPATGESSIVLSRRVVGRDLNPFEAEVDGDRVQASPRSWVGQASVIIPTRNRADLLERCVESILTKTRPHPPEIIVHDNGSDEASAKRLLERYAATAGIRVLRDDLPFNFSRINNEAAAVAGGNILLFLNNDTEVLSGDWVDQLASVVSEPHVGCAGALLLTPGGTIQHAGLVTGPGGIAAHVHFGMTLEQADPVAPVVRRPVSAVTGACLAIEKSKFLAIGGFDDEHFPVAFNDVDLCLRLERQGLRTIFVPEAKLIHLGSATREDDDFTSGTDRFRTEFRLMRDRWGARLDADPYFPRHMRLTRSGPQLRLA